MKKHKNIAVLGIITAILSFVFSAPLVLAAIAGADVTVGASERYTPSVTQTVEGKAGNVTEVNVSTVQVTDKWVGFWGHVSGSIVLADANGNYFYKWTISDPTGGVVYVTNASVSDWSTLAPVYADSGVLPAFLLQGTDSFNYTFTEQEDFISPSKTVNAVNYTYTWQGGNQGTTFKTYAMQADNGAVLVWAGNVVADQTSFKGDTVTADYQILAGVNTQGGQQTFYFYLELP